MIIKMKAADFGVDMPKGVMIVGFPGCGKSLSAKAAAKLFEVPLLRLDMGRLMRKYVGDSEANLRKALALTEAIAPCVLWTDEIEKAFAGIGGQGGAADITTRLFGNFLTWMQEKESAVFVVATANDISKIPPELLRKGRFDEIFYVNLPTREERRKILEIHLKKRRAQDLASIHIPQLLEKTNEYCGADIEGIVKEAVETAFTEGRSCVTTKDLITAIESTFSLAVMMKDTIGNVVKDFEKKKFRSASLKEETK